MCGVFIGTSGWSYDHWQGSFYPANLPKTKWLEYYCQHFDTVEVNSTFYHLPREKTVRNWVQKTPSNFTFAVKASRFITHLKQLKEPEESLEKFLQVAGWFGKKLGPILFQFPPGFKRDIERLSDFLQVFGVNPTGLASPSETGSGSVGSLLRRRKRPVSPSPRLGVAGFRPAARVSCSVAHDTSPAPDLSAGTHRVTLEFRHPSWFCDEVYEVLRKANVALCFSDTPFYPYAEELTADFVYLRLHGHERLYASCYTKTQLDEYAKKIKNWLQGVGPPKGRVNPPNRRVKDVYCYFDNDAFAYAMENARELGRVVQNSKCKVQN